MLNECSKSKTVILIAKRSKMVTKWKPPQLIFYLRLVTGKKHPQIRLQHLWKVWIWTFGLLVHQISSFKEVIKLKQNFHINKVVTGKTPFFAIGLFCTHHSICLYSGFWYGRFVWKWCVFNLMYFQLKNGTPVFWKMFSFSRKFLSKLNYWKHSKFPLVVS